MDKTTTPSPCQASEGQDSRVRGVFQGCCLRHEYFGRGLHLQVGAGEPQRWDYFLGCRQTCAVERLLCGIAQIGIVRMFLSAGLHSSGCFRVFFSAGLHSSGSFSTIVCLLPQPLPVGRASSRLARFEASRERGGAREAVAERGRRTCGAGGGASPLHGGVAEFCQNWTLAEDMVEFRFGVFQFQLKVESFPSLLVLVDETLSNVTVVTSCEAMHPGVEGAPLSVV